MTDNLIYLLSKLRDCCANKLPCMLFIHLDFYICNKIHLLKYVFKSSVSA